MIRFSLVVKVAYTILVLGKPVDDIRSDDEDEEQSNGDSAPLTRKKQA